MPPRSKIQTQAQAQAQAPAPDQAPASAPPAAPADAPPAAPADAPEAVAVAAPVPDDVSQAVAAGLARVQAILQGAKELVAVFKALQKDVAKLQKAANGAGRRGRRASPASGGAGATPGAPAKLSGFAKPTSLSKELCDFLSLPADTQLSRTVVTRMLNAYISENKLQNPEDKRKINADEKLTALLRLKPGQELSYFNLQVFMAPLFERNAAPVPAQVSA